LYDLLQLGLGHLKGLVMIKEVAGRERAEGIIEEKPVGDVGEEAVGEGELGAGELTREPSGVCSGVVAAEDRRRAGVTQPLLSPEAKHWWSSE
jgi:hypothetical protein